MWIFEELNRRNVLRVAAAYIVTSWLVVQVVVNREQRFDDLDNQP